MSDQPAPPARLRGSKFSLVWLLPLVALGIAVWLGVRAVREEGPTISVSFNAGDGLVAGQTKVRHKAVDLGTVETVRLADDMQSVNVRIRMQREAKPYLTNNAQFWVVRPRFNSGGVSGIETLLSGSYIEMDPGAKDAPPQQQFTGLEQPPGVRTGEPGKTFVLEAGRLGSLGPGAPVFWRDIAVGEVLSYDIGDGVGPVLVRVFVHAPYDKFVRDGSHFWNVSGLSVQTGADGVHVEVASLQALLSGGVAFSTPQDQPDAKPEPDGTKFPLFRNFSEAQAAGYKKQQAFVSYFQSSVRGLSSGASVEFFGIQIGTVSNVSLVVDPVNGSIRARVEYEIQPERVEDATTAANDHPIDIARKLVARGARAQLRTASFITGSQVLALDFAPNAEPAELTMEGDIPVVPSTAGGLDNILGSASAIMSKLERLPLDEIGANLNGTLHSASGAMGSIDQLARKADQGLSPVLQRLPMLVAGLQDAVVKAGRTFGTLESGYGRDSQFNRDLERALSQVGDTARSIRLLADYLDRHPESLLRGRAN